jgi:anti-anti-sigma regulatory factor
MVKPPVTVSVACFDRDVWVRIEGRGNFQGSGSLKKFVHAMIQRGYRDFIIDLAACDHMDSTFMGTLTGISQNLRELGQGSLRAINVCPRNVDLLENLGLNFLFNVEPVGPELKTPAEQGAELMVLPWEANPEKEIILAAHEALIVANPVNASRFKDVLEYLRQDSPSKPSS